MVRLCLSSLRQSLGLLKQGTSAQAKESYVIMENKPCQTESFQDLTSSWLSISGPGFAMPETGMGSLLGILLCHFPLKK
jgi:hypothetical protein